MEITTRSFSSTSSVEQQPEENVQKMLYTPRRQPRRNDIYMRRTQEHIRRYDWPLVADAENERTVENASLFAENRSKRDSARKTVEIARKQVKQMARQLQFKPTAEDKPVTPYTIKSTMSPQFLKRPPNNIKVANLMSNGVSFPDAKRIRSHQRTKLSQSIC